MSQMLKALFGLSIKEESLLEVLSLRTPFQKSLFLKITFDAMFEGTALNIL